MSATPPYGRPGRLPGERPPVWRGRRENELFAGRDDELAEVWARLCQHGRLALVPAGGASGLGETELASAYQHRYQLRYDVAWWVDAGPGCDLARQFAELGRQAVAVLGRRARPGRPWLIVLAGAASPAQVEPYLPDPPAHCLVVTGRSEDSWQERTMTIGPLTPRESVMLLTGAAPMVDPAAAARLSELLGHRPGSLAELSGYLVRERTLTPELCQRLFELAVSPPGSPAAAAGPSEPASTPAVRPGPGVGPNGWARAGDDADPAARPTQATPPTSAGPSAVIDPPMVAAASSSAGAATVPFDAERGPVPAARAAPGDPGITEDIRQVAPEAGAGEGPGPGAAADPGGAGRVNDVDRLVATLMRVEYIADVDGFDHWFAEVGRLSGQTVALTSPWLAVRLTTLVSAAVQRPGPGLLDALVRGLDLVAPREDRAVAVFRRQVAEIAGGPGRSAALPGARASVSVDPYATRPIPGTDGPPPLPRGPVGAASYYFFTSHAHRRDRDRVVTFHRDLEAELHRKVRRRTEPAGFLDAERMGGGEHWPTALRDAVRTSPVLVALWTDDYFDSDWCGREFGIFQERIRRATPVGGTPPTGIIPVPWLVRETEVPPAAAELHIARMDLGRVYDDMPVLDLMRHPAAYAEYVSLLAYRVMDVARDRLPPLDAAAAKTIASSFHPRS
ncbi:toll/interleukin-1 receptor domain-containing protein [Frankia sp. AgB32]|uniref:TIR domain-containing protein n=1 Tax=Frankia sp. AgB32 TaxID=631119 RepID=UPI00200E90AD|nr:toll/interleukin-1 receptor domain-containing protein [Frankia sp. AgB32]MCK9894124.1 TIR domain-containing protein [Frankia sp. AgB32]